MSKENTVSQEDTFEYGGERFADIQMLRYRLNGFEELTLSQKKYIYCLSQAALCGRDITTDQFGRYNLLVRKTLEAVYLHYAGDKTDNDYQHMVEYLKRVWFSNGIYHHYGCEKFAPEFSEDFLVGQLKQLPVDQLPLSSHCPDLDALCDLLHRVIFDATFEPKRVNKREGDDLVVTSACNYYDGVSQQEAEDYYAALHVGEGDTPPSWGLNTRLVRRGDTLSEEQWTTESLYGPAIRQIVAWLGKAAEVAENDRQRHIISLLCDYYRTGDLRLFDEFSIEWLKEQDGRVDFINGFIEVYGDPLGLKGSWEGFVSYKDLVATRRTRTISDNAQWFEDHSPVDPRFRKAKVKGVTANVVCAAMLGGDEYPSSAIGINLPNADWIRAQYGSKSVTIGNLTEAYDKAASGNGFRAEFIIDDATRALVDQYGNLCDDLHTDLHECLGHGSGQTLPGVSADALKAYGNTIEEARADLFGLYYLGDDKMVELGLVPSAEAHHAQYYTYMMNGLMTQLTRIKPGDVIEEAHMRNRALIAHWVMEHAADAVQMVKRDGKTYVQISDYAALRDAFARLLAEIQRIKSEGDFAAAKAIVEQYAVQVDPELHAEVLERYAQLHIAPYKGFINPVLVPVLADDGTVTDIRVDYTESYTHQMLRYSSEYGFL